jgi:EAL domain-containing protein (putative c-di-GMP-specific phosphodiesterase class I)
VGVQLSIDDFGSGFSSLGHLRRLPFDEVKIDRPFVGAMLASRQDLAVVRSVIDIAHNFGWRVVAEGADPVPVRDELRRIGCDIAQGHSVSPALGGVAFREWWANQPQGT